MKSEMKRLFLVSAIAAASISITACGGGGGGSDKDPSPVTGGPAGGTADGGDEGTVRIQKTGKKIPKEEASLGRTSGVWLYRFEQYKEGVPLDSEASGELENYGSFLSTVQYVSDEEVIIEDCTSEESETLSLEEFRNSLHEKPETDTDATVVQRCDSEMEYEFFERSDTDYRVAEICEGEVIGMTEMKQISAQPQFNNGSLAFRADSGESVTTNGGVCGFMFHATFDLEDNPLKNLGLLQIVAPYEDGKVKMYMLTPDGLKPGVFDILMVDTEQSAMVTIEATVGAGGDDESPVDDEEDGDDFGGGNISPSGHTTVDEDEDIDGDSDNAGGGFRLTPSGGTITIESVDPFGTTGSFDMIQEDESRIQGNFSLDFK